MDENGRALLIARTRRVLLHHFSFKGSVAAAAFSPDGRYVAVAVGKLLQVSGQACSHALHVAATVAAWWCVYASKGRLSGNISCHDMQQQQQQSCLLATATLTRCYFTRRHAAKRQQLNVKTGQLLAKKVGKLLGPPYCLPGACMSCLQFFPCAACSVTHLSCCVGIGFFYDSGCCVTNTCCHLHAQVWHAPGFDKLLNPMQLHRTYGTCHDTITAIDWSADGQFIAAASKDLTARVYSLNPIPGWTPPTLAGHKDALVGVFFTTPATQQAAELAGQQAVRLYTVSKDGALFGWSINPAGQAGAGKSTPAAVDDEQAAADEQQQQRREQELASGSWSLASKHYFMQRGARLSAVDYHKPSGVLVVGFSNGLFELYQLPEFQVLQTLSVSHERISAAAFNAAGDWLALGCAKLGQLLVWEWRSEGYVLRQQGHYFDVSCACYSPDGAIIATGGMQDAHIAGCAVQQRRYICLFFGCLNCSCTVVYSCVLCPCLDNGGQDTPAVLAEHTQYCYILFVAPTTQLHAHRFAWLHAAHWAACGQHDMTNLS